MSFISPFKFLNDNDKLIRSFYIYIGPFHYRIFTTYGMNDITEFVNTHIIPRSNNLPNEHQAELIHSFLSGRYQRVELLNIVQ